MKTKTLEAMTPKHRRWVEPHGFRCPSEVLIAKSKSVGLTYGIIQALKCHLETLSAPERDKFETTLAADFDDSLVVKNEMQRWLSHMRKKMMRQWKAYSKRTLPN